MISQLAAFRAHTRAKRRYPGDGEAAKHSAALGLGEAGELQGVIKKELHHGHQPDRENILNEAGDVLFYLDWLLDIYDFSMEQAMHHNIDKLNRRYKKGFTVEESVNRAPKT
jgi:NTP pyrophosphatase (non-canonical NTP hydrolase)